MAWQPNQGDLDQLVQVFKDSVGNDNTRRSAAYQQLSVLQKSPDFPNYLSCILVYDPVDSYTRNIAGLQLKNILKDSVDSIDPARLAFIKQCVTKALVDPEAPIRSTAGSIISTVLEDNLNKWPEILNVLINYLDSPQHEIVVSTFNTFTKICEDIGKVLDNADPDFVKHLISKFIAKIDNPDPKIRADAIVCVTNFIYVQAQGLTKDNLEAFVNVIYKYTNDTTPNVAMLICKAMVSLLETYPQYLTPEIDNVIKFMLHNNQSPNTDVAREACEFWLAISDNKEFVGLIQPYLQQIIPILVKGMVYSDDDPEIQSFENDTADVEDKDTDIKPRFHKSRTVQQQHGENGGANTNQDDRSDASMSDDEYDDDDEDDEDVYGQWTLRKCSAASLDVLSATYRNDILPFVLPLLEGQLGNPDWKHREAGILALGAIAEGCLSGILPDLPQMIPFLINALKDTNPLVRCIACWTLSRYTVWIVTPPQQFTYQGNIEAHHKAFLAPMLEALLAVVLDNNKRVQKAACSALATLEEGSLHDLIPYLRPILITLNQAFSKYQNKNLLILYDAVGTLAESVGPALQEKEYVDLLMGPLIQKWQTTPDLDPRIFALLECIAAVAIAFGDKFIPYSQEVWERCLRIIYMILQQLEKYFNNVDGEDPPDKDFIVVTLDLLSGVAQGVESYTEVLVPLGSPNILQLLQPCMKDLYPDVRQSAYALIGDLATSAYPHLAPCIPAIMPEIINQIGDNSQSTNVSVCNNAAWAAGEIAWRSDPSMFEPFVVPLLQRLIPILCTPMTQRTLHENAAITIARLGKVNPQLVAPYMDSFIKPLCVVLRGIKDNDEKAFAFAGMLDIIVVQPNAVAKQEAQGYVVFTLLTSAILGWRDIPPELNNKFYEILTNFKNMFGAHWPQVISTWPKEMVDMLASRYNL